METTYSQIERISQLLSSKQISCIELTQKYLEKIHAENPALNAYVKVTDDVALETAKAVD